MNIYLQPIKFKDFLECFFPKKYFKYRYLGITSNPYKEGSHAYEIIEAFIRYVDSVARPKYFPKFILRLIHLFGNDNSIVRVRNEKLHQLSKKILKHIIIYDIKTKWSYYDIRIYGYFPDEIHKAVEATEKYFEELEEKEAKLDN